MHTPDGQGRCDPSTGGRPLAHVGSTVLSMGAVAWRWVGVATRIVALSALASLLFAAVMQKLFGMVPQLAGGQVGSRRVTLLAWGVFLVVLVWQARTVLHRRAPPGSGVS